MRRIHVIGGSRSAELDGGLVDDLEALGLTAVEVVAYRRLVDQPPMTASEFADGLPGEPTFEELLAGLTAKGLVTTRAGIPSRYAAVAPDVALDNLARAREQEIAKARAVAGELAQRWQRVGRSVDPHELIEIVVGREATSQRAEQIQRTANEEVLIFDKPPYASSGLGNAIELQLLTGGAVRYRCLYDRDSLELPGNYARIRELVLAGESARVSPTLPMKMVMGDGRVALLPLETARKRSRWPQPSIRRRCWNPCAHCSKCSGSRGHRCGSPVPSRSPARSG